MDNRLEVCCKPMLVVTIKMDKKDHIFTDAESKEARYCTDTKYKNYSNSICLRDCLKN